jgi:hypothetical protein
MRKLTLTKGGFVLVAILAVLALRQIVPPREVANASVTHQQTASVPVHATASDNLHIQFLRWTSMDGMLESAVSMKNTSDTNYASVSWSCEFRDREGYKTGGGVSVFYMVPKHAVAADSQSFYNNGTARVSIKCALISAEPLTAENQRLYRPSSQGGSASLNNVPAMWWRDDRPTNDQ